MVDHTQRAARLVLLDQIDRSAQSDALRQNCFECELGVNREPAAVGRGKLPEPAVQVPADLLDLAVPDARNGRREIFFILRRHAVQDAVGDVANLAQPRPARGQEACAA